MKFFRRAAAAALLTVAFPFSAFAGTIPDETRVLSAPPSGYETKSMAGARLASGKPALADIRADLDRAALDKEAVDYAGAERVLNGALERSPDDADALFLLGRIEYLDSKPTRAVKIFQKLFRFRPSDSAVALNLGLAHEDAGQKGEAVRYYRRAVFLDKNNVRAHWALARLNERAQKWNVAIREYEAVRDLDPSIESLYDRLARLYVKARQWEKALKAYRKLGLLKPDASFAGALSMIERHLGTAYFKNERRERSLAKSHKAVLVKVPVLPPGYPLIRVGLAENVPSVEFECFSDFRAKKKDGSPLLKKGFGGKNYILSADHGRIVLTTAESKGSTRARTKGPVKIEPVLPGATVTLFDMKLGDGNFWSSEQDRSFRGRLEIRATDKGLTVINVLSLEEYLYSVVPSEMPADWPDEALKAQVIAARTEALHKLKRHAAQGYDLCSTVHCQSYTGVEQETPRIDLLVDRTRGLVMTHDGKIIDAIYSSSCGGHTQDNIFGGTDEPYLKGRSDLEDGAVQFPMTPFMLERWLKASDWKAFCNESGYARPSDFRWTRSYASADLDALAGPLGVGHVQRIHVLKREPSGHISALEIIGDRSSATLNGELTIRSALGKLRSSLFEVEVKFDARRHEPERFIFFGGGWGHGVGLCQTGAAGMAGEGKTCREILTHYFCGIDLKKIGGA